MPQTGSAPAHSGASSVWKRISSGNTLWIFLVLVAVCAVFSAAEAARVRHFLRGPYRRHQRLRAARRSRSGMHLRHHHRRHRPVGGFGARLRRSRRRRGDARRQSTRASTPAGAPCSGGWSWRSPPAWLWGLVNGFLRAVARVPALIVTLGTLGAAYGLSQIITHGQDLRGVPALLANDIGLGRGLRRSPLDGRHRGGHHPRRRRAAQLHPVRPLHSRGRLQRRGGTPGRHQRPSAPDQGLRACKGLLAGLAGFLALAYYNTTTISGHSSDNLAAITAVVIGGTSLFGGRGTVIGSAIGVFIPAVLASGFVIVGVQSYWQNVALGIVLVLAVYVDQLRRRSRERP